MGGSNNSSKIKTLKKILTILAIVIGVIFIIYLLLGSLFIMAFFGFFSNSKTEEINIDIININENPILNNRGQIEEIKVELIFDSSTPVPDGIYYYKEAYLMYNDEELGQRAINIYLDDEAIIRENKLIVTLNSRLLNEIRNKSISGPYVLRIGRAFFNDNPPGKIDTIKYILNFQDSINEQYCRDSYEYCNSDIYFKTKEFDFNQFTYCYDTDKGINPSKFGRTSGPNPIDEKIYERKDFCLVDGRVNEYYCNEDGYLEGIPIECDGNEICENGFC